ncbi:MAG: hypothetical protein P8179_11325 [Candidatus Thiodiazotropha sp.]
MSELNQREKQVREQVDRLLFEQGVYQPLEMLFTEGRLMYADYEAWREGDGAYLEEKLFGSPEQSREMLQLAEAYAIELGLASELQRYTSWVSGKRTELRFSSQLEVNRCFQTAYRKSDEMPQLDLLMDSPGTTLANGIIQALLNRDVHEAAQLVEQLHEVDPSHHQLGGFEGLVEAACRATPLEEPLQELHYLLQELKPMAEEILGVSSHPFLVPFWRSLAQALDDMVFDDDYPERHASYASLQAEDWYQLKARIEQEANWRDHFVLLQRHGLASARLHQEVDALVSWFMICWRFPDQASSIAAQRGSEWWRGWQCFLDLEPELPDEDFPAWLFIDNPSLAKRFTSEVDMQELNPPDAFQLVAELMQAKSEITDAQAIMLRKQLQQANQRLFGHYMERF